MKYFTAEWWFDHCNDVSVFAKYQAYLDSVRSTLPRSFDTLISREVMLHDATLRKMLLNDAGKSLTIELDGIKYDNDGDEIGVQAITIVYEPVVSLKLLADDDLQLSCRNPFGDLGYDEIECIADDRYEHRMIFRNGVELQVQFERFALNTIDRLYE